MRTDAYYFCLMLVLVIPQIETSVVFVFNLRIQFASDVSDYLQKIKWVSKGVKKYNTFWTSALVKVGAGQDVIYTRYHKWEGSLFTLGLLHKLRLKGYFS